MIEKKYIKDLYDISDNIDDVVRKFRNLIVLGDGLTDDEKSKIEECKQKLLGVSEVIWDIYRSNSDKYETAEKKAYDEVFMSANRNSESFEVFSSAINK